MGKYLDMIRDLEDAGYVVGENIEGTFYWSTYLHITEGFESEEEAWNAAYTDCYEGKLE